MNKITTKEDLSLFLNIELKYLLFYSYGKKRRYRYFTIPKKNGGLRKISAPNNNLFFIQKRIKEKLEEYYIPNENKYAHGFVIGRSIVTNAKLHKEKKYLLNLDLKDFFSTIHFGRVRGLFIKGLKFGEEAATYLARLCCDDNMLPQGSPCSPIISNMICKKMDRQLSNLAKSYDMVYSRYGDDISFSSDKPFHQDIYDYENNEIGHKLYEIINNNKFLINSNKIRHNKYYQHQEVTGIVVNEKLNNTKKYIRLLRSELHNIQVCKELGYTFDQILAEINKYGHCFSNKGQLYNYLCGKINFIRMVKGPTDKVFLKYAQQFEKIFENKQFDTLYYLDRNKWIEANCVVIDPDFCDEQTINGTGFFVKGVGLVTCFHVVQQFVIGKTDDNKIIDDCFIHIYYQGKKEIKNIRNASFSEKKDILIIPYNNNDDLGFNYEKETEFDIGRKIILAGYPNYDFCKNDGKITIFNSEITGGKRLIDIDYYTINGRILHGSSGGPVLNKDYKVIGVISHGEIDEKENTEIMSGFVPFNLT